MFRTGKCTETERLVIARGWKEEEWGVTANGYGVSFQGDKKVLELDTCDVAQPCEYIVLKTNELYTSKG